MRASLTGEPVCIHKCFVRARNNLILVIRESLKDNCHCNSDCILILSI